MGQCYGIRPSELLKGDPDLFNLDAVIYALATQEVALAKETLK